MHTILHFDLAEIGRDMPRGLGVSTLRILAALRDGATYGLDIVARTDIPSGTVYPALRRLARKDMVESRWEDPDEAERAGRPRRRYYELTPEGAAALAAGAKRMRAATNELAPSESPS
jgi:PadR family transcriptional regulator PadR